MVQPVMRPHSADDPTIRTKLKVWQVLAFIDALASEDLQSEAFKSRLDSAFALGREEKLDIAALKGSYAGAMGMGQFMPSSYREFAVDGNGDGRRDLLRGVRAPRHRHDAGRGVGAAPRRPVGLPGPWLHPRRPDHRGMPEGWGAAALHRNPPLLPLIRA